MSINTRTESMLHPPTCEWAKVQGDIYVTECGFITVIEAPIVAVNLKSKKFYLATFSKPLPEVTERCDVEAAFCPFCGGILKHKEG